MKSKKKRYSITLLEMMIVIVLIAMVGGVLSYHLKGALDQGKKFKTEEGIRRLKSLLEFQVMQGFCLATKLEGKSTQEVVQACLLDSKLIPPHLVKTLVVDGWGRPYDIQVIDDDIVITSQKLHEQLVIR